MSTPGFTDEPEPPEHYRAVETFDLVRYTDVSQAKWFFDRLAWQAGGRWSDVNARLDPVDGTTIRWYGNYYNLPLGHYLYDGSIPLTPEQVGNSSLRPLDHQWPYPIEPISNDTTNPTE